MPDSSLHTRYMAAHTTWRTHRASCPPCQSGQHCKSGAPLFGRFVRLQDAYLAQQSRRS